MVFLRVLVYYHSPYLRRAQGETSAVLEFQQMRTGAGGALERRDSEELSLWWFRDIFHFFTFFNPSAKIFIRNPIVLTKEKENESKQQNP